MGRPRLELNEDQVYELAKLMCTHEEIAAVMGCHKDTIADRFSELILKGREEGKISLRRAQMKNALNGNTSMQIWLGKQYLGQKDKIEGEGFGTNVYVTPGRTFVFRDFTEEEVAGRLHDTESTGSHGETVPVQGS